MSQKTEHTFVSLLEENQNIIHKICRLYTNTDDQHKDLFQEIAVQLWKSYPNFKGNSKFSTWMYRVALNTAITLFKKSKRSVKTYEIESHLYKIEDSLDNSDDEQEKINLLYKSIRHLTDIEKALVFLYLEDKNYKEIALTLGITEVNARVKMNRIKTKLHKIINP